MEPVVQIEIQDKNSLQESPTKRIDPSENEGNPRFKSDIEKANILSRLNFVYAYKLVSRAFKLEKQGKSIQKEDMISFAWKKRADVLANRFTYYLQRQKRNQKKKMNLTLAILQAIKWPLIWCLIIQTAFTFSKIFSGWVMYKLINSYIYPDEFGDDAYKWAGVLSGVFVFSFYTQHHFDHFVMSFPNHIQNALTNIIYNKIINLSMYSLTQISQGKLINLASNDISILEQRSMFFTNIIVGTFALIAGGAVLWQFFGVCCLVGLGYLVLWPPLQEIAFILSHKEREQTTEITDDRIRLTSETVENIRLLKMYTWELRFKEKIAALRKAEHKLLKKGGIVQAVSDAISFSSLPCASFLMYLAYFYTGGELTAANVFASYYILGFLRLHSSFFVQLGLGFATEIKLVFNRIEKVLEELEVGDVAFKEPLVKENAIEFDNYTSYWTAPPQSTPDRGTKLVDNDHPVLSNINLHIKKGSLNALVGTVSSGKTSLLHSFTGEIPRYTGSLRCKGTFAYVEQEPTIFAGTIRDNILFGKPYDEAYYDKVVKACNLENDLKMFPKGDMSELVGGGNNLSGGQKARLALARAVYSNADIYLLDDPLSAVDPKVARSLYNNAIDGVLKGKTVILVTHQVDFAVRCEKIIVMEGGQVVGSGTYEELKSQGIQTLERLFGKTKKNVASEEPEEIPHHHHHHHDKAEKTTTPNAENQVAKKDKEEEKPEEKDPYDGKVTGKTYLTLFKEMGGPYVIAAILLSCLACEFSNIAYGRMLGAWLSGTFATWKTLAILGGLVGFNIFIHLVKFFITAVSLSRASASLHNKMLNRIIQATVLFFDMNSVGQIVTRFANDLGALDRFFPLAINDILNITYALGSTAITAAIIDPILIAPLAAVFIFTGFMLWLCYPSVKQTKAHEIGTKDPLFGLFSATLSGITIIRIYNQGEAFKKRFRQLLHDTVKGSVAYSLSGRFLGFYCDGAYVLAVVACIFIITARSVGDPQNGFLAAFSLALILSVTGILQHGLRQLTQLNIFMSATARIHAYSKVPNEPALTLSSDDEQKKVGWPEQGKIDFNKVYMKYRPDADYVIRDLNLDVKPGQKIGCVGRTGAGKTTIVQLMYRMREIDKQLPGTEDSYIKIDDVNTQSLGLHLLRSNVSVIPQSPVIFSGTIRMNIDPLGEFSDEEIWKVLGDVRLKDHVEKQKSKLDTFINTGSSVFSVGQKQLVCLGRAILRPSNILIMDEATANMDEDTDSFLQTTIKQKFAHSTQFTIAHRLATIASYDRVLVLDKGRRVEFDEPYRLLVKNIGDEHFTNPEGYFTGMVLNTGPITSKKIFEIARNSYFERHGHQEVDRK